MLLHIRYRAVFIKFCIIVNMFVHYFLRLLRLFFIKVIIFTTINRIGIIQWFILTNHRYNRSSTLVSTIPYSIFRRNHYRNQGFGWNLFTLCIRTQSTVKSVILLTLSQRQNESVVHEDANSNLGWCFWLHYSLEPRVLCG